MLMQPDVSLRLRAGWLTTFAVAALTLSGCSTGTDATGDDLVEGTLQLVMVGNADMTASTPEYFVETEDGRSVKLLFDVRPELLHRHLGDEHAMLQVESRSRVRAVGFREASGELQATRVELVALPIEEAETSDSLQQGLVAAS